MKREFGKKKRAEEHFLCRVERLTSFLERRERKGAYSWGEKGF